MKQVFFLAAIIAGLLACKNTDGDNTSKAAIKAEKDSANFTTIEWADPVQNLGMLKFGEKKKINFHFKNTGTKPLFIIFASPSCGCTVADFPKNAIAPGAVGEIVAEFDTNKGHPGNFHKAISVKTNTKGSTLHSLVFEGEIKKEGENNSTNNTSAPAPDSTHQHKH